MVAISACAISNGVELKEIQAQLAAKKETQGEGHLTVDVFKSGNDIIVQSTIAGADPADLDISITKDMVTIRGRREFENKIKTSDYYHRELYWGSFSRSIILPVDIDPDNAKATMKNGVLTIRLPRLEK